MNITTHCQSSHSPATVHLIPCAEMVLYPDAYFLVYWVLSSIPFTCLAQVTLYQQKGGSRIITKLGNYIWKIRKRGEEVGIKESDPNV